MTFNADIRPQIHKAFKDNGLSVASFVVMNSFDYKSMECHRMREDTLTTLQLAHNENMALRDEMEAEIAAVPIRLSAKKVIHAAGISDEMIIKNWNK